MLIMITYWFTEVIPMSITALIPVVLFPLMNIVNSEVISKAYFNVSNHLSVVFAIFCSPFAGNHYGLLR